MIKHLNCPACDKSNSEFFFKSVKKDSSYKNFIYLKCSFCKTIFLSKKNFSNQKLINYHLKHWYKKGNFKFDKNIKKNKYIDNWYKTYKTLKLNNKSKVLDIGCGDGSFLLALKKLKFNQLYGFDSDPTIIKKIKQKYIKFFCDNFSNFVSNKKISGLKFDYVFLHDVIEHSLNPSELLKNIKQIIKKNSQIYIKIPSGECLQLELLKEYNWTSFAPFHRSLFSKKGIAILLKKNGFNKIKLISSNSINWGWTRGISWKLKLEKYYENLRKNKKFKKFDFEIDNLFEKISLMIGKEPTIFLKCSLKK